MATRPNLDCSCDQHSGLAAELGNCIDARKQNTKDHEILFGIIGKKVSMTLFLWVMAILAGVLGGVFTSQMKMYESMNGIAKDVAVIMERTKK